jgi:uncharacterized protein
MADLDFDVWLDGITLLGIVALMIVGFITGRHKLDLLLRMPAVDFYKRTLVQDLLILMVLFALRPGLFLLWQKPEYGVGWVFSDQVYFIIFVGFTTQLVLNFTPFTQLYPKEIKEAKNLMGLPTALLPGNGKEWGFFAFFLIFGVLFEEILCRYVLFKVLHSLWGWEGDLLVVITALLFSLPHSYQGPKGLLSSFVMGVVLGKMYLHYGTLWAPLLLHYSINLGILPLAMRRIWDLKNLSKAHQENL